MYLYDYDFFFDEVGELLEHLDIDETNIHEWPEGIMVEVCELELFVTLSADWILERIDEERYPEDDNDRTYERAKKALETVDYEAINLQMPKLWYGTGKKHKFTQDELRSAL